MQCQAAAGLSMKWDGCQLTEIIEIMKLPAHGYNKDNKNEKNAECSCLQNASQELQEWSLHVNWKYSQLGIWWHLENKLNPDNGEK